MSTSDDERVRTAVLVPDEPRQSSVAVHRASVVLVATVWISVTLFGAYILAHYAGAVTDADLPSWNPVLPRLYEPTTLAATVAISVHFLAGGVILVLGCVQLLASLRARWPAMHRWLGRVYVAACLLAGLGGLGFIAAKGTVGGLVMDLGFGLYGVLVVVCAVQAYRYGRARRIEQHRAWALRLFALAIGSWLYRMEYGFWLLLVGEVGHTDDFRGGFDCVMAFFFYVPNLLVVERCAAAAEGRPRQGPGASPWWCSSWRPRSWCSAPTFSPWRSGRRPWRSGSPNAPTLRGAMSSGLGPGLRDRGQPARAQT